MICSLALTAPFALADNVHRDAREKRVRRPDDCHVQGYLSALARIRDSTVISIEGIQTCERSKIISAGDTVK
jgi:hypothetical protein